MKIEIDLKNKKVVVEDGIITDNIGVPSQAQYLVEYLINKYLLKESNVK